MKLLFHVSLNRNKCSYSLASSKFINLCNRDAFYSIFGYLFILLQHRYSELGCNAELLINILLCYIDQRALFI